MVNKIEFNTKNFTSSAILFLLFEHAQNYGVFDLINETLTFGDVHTNKIKMY